MQRRPLVYVSRITNLSDARYCAGMGVDMLGFVVDPADPDYVSPESYREMVGWISGPARVAEAGTAPIDEKLHTMYEPGYLHVSWKRLHEIPSGNWKVIVEASAYEIDQLIDARKCRSDISYLLLNGEVNSLPSDVLVLVSPPTSGTSIAQLLQSTGAAGIALHGSREVSPGLKDYDDLARVLEELDG